MLFLLWDIHKLLQPQVKPVLLSCKVSFIHCGSVWKKRLYSETVSSLICYDKGDGFAEVGRSVLSIAGLRGDAEELIGKRHGKRDRGRR